MEILFIFLGAIIAVAIYLFFINKLHESEDKAKKEEIEVASKEEEEGQSSKTKEKPESLKPRFCPLCKSELKKGESVYAEMYKGEKRPKVIIHGCKYCYVPGRKKTNFTAKDINLKNE